MWWIFGLINLLFVFLSAWFFDRKIKKDTEKWTLEDKCAFSMFGIFAFVGGGLVSLLLGCLLIFLIIDFIIYNKNK